MLWEEEEQNEVSETGGNKNQLSAVVIMLARNNDCTQQCKDNEGKQ